MVSRQLTLAEAHERQRLLDPWTEERKRHAGLPVMRVIYLDRGEQYFYPLQASPLAKGEARLMDGATVIVTEPRREISPQEHDRIVREWDDVWRARQ